jgi:hypothetical protein
MGWDGLRIKGVGPVYVGYEAICVEPKVVSRAWFRELTEPWRMGRGWRLRIGHHAVQVGICKKNPLAEQPSALSQLGGYDLAATPEQIGRWGLDAVEEKGPDPAA